MGDGQLKSVYNAFARYRLSHRKKSDRAGSQENAQPSSITYYRYNAPSSLLRLSETLHIAMILRQPMWRQGISYSLSTHLCASARRCESRLKLSNMVMWCNRDHDTANIISGNLAAFCQRCRMNHDRPEHRRRHWRTVFCQKATGNLFAAPCGTQRWRLKRQNSISLTIRGSAHDSTQSPLACLELSISGCSRIERHETVGA